MLKLSKKADYALIAVRHLAAHGREHSHSASDIAEAYGISAPILAKVLQRLAKHGLVTARHGSSGGYQLARHPKDISALEVISAAKKFRCACKCSTLHLPSCVLASLSYCSGQPVMGAAVNDGRCRSCCIEVR